MGSCGNIQHTPHYPIEGGIRHNGCRSLVDDILSISALLNLDEDGSLSQKPVQLPTQNYSSIPESCTAVPIPLTPSYRVLDLLEKENTLLKEKVRSQSDKLRKLRKEAQESRKVIQARKSEARQFGRELSSIRGRLYTICDTVWKLVGRFADVLLQFGVELPSLENQVEKETVVDELERKVGFLVKCKLEESIGAWLFLMKQRIEAEVTALRDTSPQNTTVATATSNNGITTSDDLHQVPETLPVQISHEIDLTKEGYVCKCSETFSNEKELKRHLTTAKRFVCCVCGSKFFWDCTWRKHMEQEHNVEIQSEGYNCHLCDTSFGVFDDLTEHWRERHSRKSKRKCVIRPEMRTYSNESPGKPPSTCLTLAALLAPSPPLAPTPVESTENVSMPEQEEQPPHEQEITEVTHQPQIAEVLLNPLRYNIESNKFECGYCQAEFSQSSNLSEHLESTHGVNFAGSSVEVSMGSYRSCPSLDIG